MKESEMERWMLLTYKYMTEESDDDDNPNSIILHKIEWRSNSKCKLTHFLYFFYYDL